MESYLFYLALIVIIPAVLAFVNYSRNKQLSSNLWILSGRVKALEDAIALQHQPPPQNTEPPTVPDIQEVWLPSAITSPPQVAPPPSFLPPPPPVPQPKAARTNAELEMLLGGKLLNRIGAIATVLGVMFFLKYAIDNNWISEWMRVIIGVVVSTALIVVADRLRKKDYVLIAQGCIGAAVPILYLSVFAAFNFYHLIPQLVAYFCLVVVTVVTVWLATVHKSVFISYASVLGAIATPFLISDGTVNSTGLLVHIFLFMVAFTAIPLWMRKWHELGLVAGLGALVLLVMLLMEQEMLLVDFTFTFPLVDIVLMQLILVVALVYEMLLNSEVKPTINELSKGWAVLVYCLFAGAISWALSDYNNYIDAGGQLTLTLLIAGIFAVTVKRIGSNNGTATMLATLAFITSLTIVPGNLDSYFFMTGISASIIAAALLLGRYDLRVPAMAVYLTCVATTLTVVLSPRTYWGIDVDAYGIFSWSYPLFNLRFGAIVILAVAMYVTSVFMKYRDGARYVSWPNVFRSVGYCLAAIAIATDLHHTVYNYIYYSSNFVDGYDRLYYISETAGIVCAVVLGTISVIIAQSLNKRYLASAGCIIYLIASTLWLLKSINTLPDEMYSSLFNLRFEAGLVVLACGYLLARAPLTALGDGFQRYANHSLWILFAAVSFFIISAEAIMPVVVEQNSIGSDNSTYTSLQNQLQLTLSLTWLAYAVAVLVIGFIKKLRVVRLTGIGLLGLSVLKIFLYDLSYLAQLERIVSFVVLGVILLAASFAYQKYAPKG